MTPDEYIEYLEEMGFRVYIKKHCPNGGWHVIAIRRYKIGPRKGLMRFRIGMLGASKKDALRATVNAAMVLLRKPHA